MFSFIIKSRLDKNTFRNVVYTHTCTYAFLCGVKIKINRYTSKGINFHKYTESTFQVLYMFVLIKEGSNTFVIFSVYNQAL